MPMENVSVELLKNKIARPAEIENANHAAEAINDQRIRGQNKSRLNFCSRKNGSHWRHLQRRGHDSAGNVPTGARPATLPARRIARDDALFITTDAGLTRKFCKSR